MKSFIYKKIRFAVLAAFLICSQNIYSQLIVEDSVTATDLANALAGPGVTISNVTLNCNQGSYGTFDGTNTNLGIDGGVILSTGLVAPPEGCQYYVYLQDAAWNNWTCGFLEIYINGVLYGSFTENSGFGWTTIPLFIQTGQTISFNYVTTGGIGCDESEHTIDVYDASWTPIVSEGFNYTGGPVPPGNLYSGVANCPPGGGAFYGAAGPNDYGMASFDGPNDFNDPDMTQIFASANNDVCVLEFDIVPICDTLQIKFVFGSEEYYTFVCSGYNDSFGFFISGPGINGPFTNNAINMGYIPGTTTPVTINTVNNGNPIGSACTTPAGTNCPCNSSLYIDNGDPWACPGPAWCTDSTYVRYNGLTQPMTAKSAVQPCETYHMKIVIADGSDGVLDSGVFLDYQGLSCTSTNIDVTVNDDTICTGNSTILTADLNGGNPSNFNIQWTNNDGSGWTASTIDVLVSPTTTTQYYVLVTDNCGNGYGSDTATVLVTPGPVVTFSANPLSGCTPLDVVFTNTTDTSVVQSVAWNLGDGTTSTNVSTVSHTYPIPGCYDISLSMINIGNCAGDTTYSQFICVNPQPVADFYFGPQPTTVAETEINFTNTSSGADNYIWVIEGLDTISSFNLSYVFPDTEPGDYPVCLYISNTGGCMDTVCGLVTIGPDLSVFVPNAFSPNDDGKNDIFLPMIVGQDETQFSFTIYNRWGELVFSSESSSTGWDGTYKGLKVKNDVYVWKLQSVNITTFEVKEYKGHVTVVR